ASAARLYPLDDRLVFFAVPTLWLLRAVGNTRSFSFCWPGSQFFHPLSGPSLPLTGVPRSLSLFPLIPGWARYRSWTAGVPHKAEFRQAFEFVQGRADRNDLLWVSHAEVYEVYFGRDPSRLVDENDDLRDRRIWVVTTPGTEFRHDQELVPRMQK